MSISHTNCCNRSREESLIIGLYDVSYIVLNKHKNILILHIFISVFFVVLIPGNNSAWADGWNPDSKAPNNTSIEFTRHNLTLSYNSEAGGTGFVMDQFRNNYGEICVYCHTPHGANQLTSAPLWNRTINTNQYTIYNKPRTLEQPIGQPGPNSLTCLSCHDGTIAIDSIINMPGSGGYNQAQQTGVSQAFLNTWTGPGPQNTGGAQHYSLGPESVVGKCTLCHSVDNGTAMSNFKPFTIGEDLTDDHPIGILYPETFGSGTDFNQTSGITEGKIAYFDSDGDGFPDKNEVRLYESGEGYEVECASCHDPHGVPSDGEGSQFIASFLRVSNGDVNTGQGSPSGLCLTCHNK